LQSAFKIAVAFIRFLHLLRLARSFKKAVHKHQSNFPTRQHLQSHAQDGHIKPVA